MAGTKHPPKPKRGKKIEAEAIGVIYARYSSHSQRDISIEQQIAKDQELAAEYGIKVVSIYADRAVSGRTDKRKEFQKMMREVSKYGVKYVIAWKSNRIGRNMLEAMINETRLQDMGVRVLYVEEDFDDTAAGLFAARSMMNVNQFYSDAMSEDIRRGLMDNAEKCMVNGSLPFGYRRSKDGYYEIDPEKAEIVREIFKRFLHEESFADIGRDLNGRGIRTKRGNTWNKNSFHRILSNDTYIGVYSYSGIRKENGVPAIITKEVFYAAQERLKTKPNPVGRHRMNSDYLLTGKLFCGHCGSPMVGVSGTSRTGNKHYYYDTPDGPRGKIVCNYTGKNSELELSLSDLENIKNMDTVSGSYKFPLCPPRKRVFCPADKRLFFRTGCSAFRNVKYAAQVMHSSCVMIQDILDKNAEEIVAACQSILTHMNHFGLK